MDLPKTRFFQFETNGINVIPDKEKVSTSRDIFWIWFGANIGILGVLYGVIVAGFHLDFLQAVLAALIGALSFVLVGMLSIPGRDGSAPMFVLSKIVFGSVGNCFPGFINWLNLVGWESVMVITGSLSLQALLDSILGIPVHAVTGVFGMLIFIGLIVLFSLFGYGTLAHVQKIASWAFGALTLGIVLLLLRQGSWHTALHAPTGSWLGGFLPATSVVIAGTSISWAPAAADYSRYVSRKVKTGSLIWAVTFGGAVPLFALMLTGILVANKMPNLPASSNPIAVIGGFLPGWMRILYLITVTGGLVAEANLGMYSSGLNLMAIGVKLPRRKTIWFDAVITVAITIYVLFVRQDFLSPFQSFLTLIGVSLAAWAGVFLSGWPELRRRSGYDALQINEAEDKSLTIVNWKALVSWGIGVIVGFMLTATPLFTGPLAHGAFATSNLGILAAFLIGGILNGLATILTGLPIIEYDE